jgi:hypothetical protein
MQSVSSLSRNQSVRFHDCLVQIETVILNDIESLCLEDVQRRFPSVTVLSIDNIQVGFLRDDDGNYLIPLRIKAYKDRIIDAFDPMEKSNDIVRMLFDRMDTRLQEMDRKTDLILANTQETLVRIKHVMTQMYELHEYTTPRYFFILPSKHHHWNSVNTVKNWFLLHYKLYFLCECSTEPNKLHMAPHNGYSIKEPSEFIATYGSYLRTTLAIARSILSVGGLVLPQSNVMLATAGDRLAPLLKEPNNYTDVNDKLDLVEKMLNQTDHDLAQIDSSTIQCVNLTNVKLQGAQLRELQAFLEHADQRRSLGNLYRMMTDDGHVRWVCLEHYNAIGFHRKMSEFIRLCESIGGKYDTITKELVLQGNLMSKQMNMICDALEQGFAVLSLLLVNCSVDVRDMDRLFYSILNRSSICRLELISIEISQWIKMSKSVCDHMIVYYKNQSIRVQYDRGCHGGGTKVLMRLLQQNDVCRSFELSGFDLSIDDIELYRYLKVKQEMTTFIVNFPVHAEALRAILTNCYSLKRLKLRFSFNISAHIWDLCRIIENNQTLVDLDLMDHTCVDDSAVFIELLTIIQRHPTIKHLRLHIFDVESSHVKKKQLIAALRHHSFITHLRISDSLISHEFTEALIYACRERHALTHLEFYNSQLDHNDLSNLQISYADNSLLHLSMCDQSYWSNVFADVSHLQNTGQCLPMTSSQKIYSIKMIEM